MALFDFLKNKDAAEKAKEQRKQVKPQPKVSDTKEKKTEKAETKPAVKASTAKNIKTKGFSYNIVKEPHISEKASLLSETANQYVFKVFENANKTEIKKSVEGIYGVNVLSVNITKALPKKRRMGRSQGFRKGYTKAIVTVKEGQKIEIL